MLQKWQVHNQVKSYLCSHCNENIGLIKITTENLSFNEDEIEMNGEMYDVVKVVAHKNQLTLYCFDDKNESAVAKKIAGLVLNEHQKKSTNDFYNRLANLFFFTHHNTETICFNSALFCFSTAFAKLNALFFVTPNLDILSPPPKG